MASLAAMQRAAEREAKKLGITTPLTVQWAGPSTCKVRKQHAAHAHCGPSASAYGMICIRRGNPNDWRETIKHEVAHFAPGANNHGVGFIKALAAQGSIYAKRQLVAMGKRRCPKHEWTRLGMPVSQTITPRGLMLTYRAYCRLCGKEIGS